MNQQTVMETVFFVLLVFYFVLHDNFLIDNKIALLLKQIICNIILNDHWLTHCFPNWLLYLLGIKGQENKNTKTSWKPLTKSNFSASAISGYKGGT